MPQMQDEAGNIWEVDAQGNAISLVQPAQQAGPITMGTPDPSFGAQQRITENKAGASNYDPALAAAELEAKKRDIAIREAEEARKKYEFDKEVKADQSKGDPSEAARYTLGRIIDKIDAISVDAGDNSGWFETGYTGSLNRARPGTAAFDLAADLKTLDANAAFRALQEMRDNSPTGGALGQITEKELDLLKSTIANLDPDQSLEQFQANLQQARNVYSDMLGKVSPEAPQENAIGRTAGGADATQQRTYAAGDGQTSYKGGAYSTEQDKAIGAQMQSIFDQGGGIREINAVLGSNPFRPGTPEFNKLVEALEYRDQGGQGAKILAPQTGFKEQSFLGGLADSNLGAAAIGAGNVASLGTLDEMANLASVDGVQETKEYLRDQYGLASALGEVGGGVGTFLGAGRAALKAAPRLGAGGSAAVGDIGAGAAFGAGESNQNRLQGALLGGGAAIVGEGLGRMIPKATGRAIAPTGGSMRPLYNEGVRPTIGQRVADKGVLGSAINKIEEGAQSLPIVGNMVTGARQGARDQFETGAFNRSLREIGTELPAEAPYGPEAFQYAGQAFDDAYGNARAGMQFQPDPQFTKDFGNLQREVTDGGMLDSEAINQFGKTIQTTVGSRMRQGGMAGDVYKKTVSDLGKKISQTTKPELRQALQEFRNIMDDAARRNSDPQAVAAMDAADRGYSQYKPLQQAQERAGSDAGRFTPKALEATERMGMKKTRTYREGGGALRDYVEASKGLNDTLPNSGTADRVFQGGGLAAMGGAALFDPSVAAVMAGSTLPYAPGIRNLQALMMAPRKNQMLNQAGQNIYDSAKYLGPLGAASSVPLLTQ